MHLLSDDRRGGAKFSWGTCGDYGDKTAAAGAAYERIRNAVDYEEEHLCVCLPFAGIMRRVQAMEKHTPRAVRR